MWCYGIDVEENVLCDIASHYGWYEDGIGVHMSNNGKLLGCFGIPYHHSQNNTIEDISVALERKQKVMVNINPAKISLNEIIVGHNEACHAVLVDSINSNDGKIFITNPATGILNQMCYLDNFVKSWEDSSFYMLATEKESVYEYDHNLKLMFKL